jgi:hypothetical protein
VSLPYRRWPAGRAGASDAFRSLPPTRTRQGESGGISETSRFAYSISGRLGGMAEGNRREGAARAGRGACRE